jgi:hypothetical protein
LAETRAAIQTSSLDRCPVDRLQNEFEIEGKLQFADHHDRRYRIAEPDEIAAADLALDDIAGRLQKGFDRQIKRRLHANRLTFSDVIVPERPDLPHEVNRTLQAP